MSDKNDNYVPQQEWRTLKTELERRGKPLNEMLPIRHAGRKYTLRGSSMRCGHCNINMAPRHYIAVIDIQDSADGPLVLRALGSCPMCKKYTLFQRRYVARTPQGAKGATPRSKRQHKPTPNDPFDLVAWTNWISARRGETNNDRCRPLFKRFGQRIASTDAFMPLFGFCCLGWAITQSLAGIMAVGYSLSALYEFAVLWASQGHATEQKQE